MSAASATLSSATTASSAAATSAIEAAKRLEKLERLAEACAERARGKTTHKIRSLLQPFPQGYWVTRHGTIVKLTVDAVVWPTGKREKLHVDLHAGLLEVCPMTATLENPNSSTRRARFVAGEIVWESYDRWVQYVPEETLEAETCGRGTEYGMLGDVSPDPRRKPDPFILGDALPSVILEETSSKTSSSRTGETEEDRSEASSDGDQSEGSDDRNSSGSNEVAAQPARRASLMQPMPAISPSSVPRHTTSDVPDASTFAATFPMDSRAKQLIRHSHTVPAAGLALTQADDDNIHALPASSVERLDPSPLGSTIDPTIEETGFTLGSRSPSGKKRTGNGRRFGLRSRGRDGAAQQKPKERFDMSPFSVSGDFRKRFKAQKTSEQPADLSVDIWKVTQAARRLDMTLDEVRDVIYTFNSIDLDQSGELDYSEFERAAMSILQGGPRKAETAVVKLSCKEDWASCQRVKSDMMNLEEFLEWFSRMRFRADLLLSKEQRDMIGLAKKYQITERAIDQIKLAFDTFDKDGSGMIHLEEFQGVLKMVMRLPNDIELPFSRMQRLWREIDIDSSGEACFEEFLRWWISRKETLIPYDHFYKNVRCLRSQQYDPAAYAPAA